MSTDNHITAEDKYDANGMLLIDTTRGTGQGLQFIVSYSLFTSKAGVEILSSILRYIFAPLSLFFAMLEMFSFWYHASLHNETRLYMRAIIELAAFFAAMASIILTFGFGAMYAAAAPIIAVFMASLKILFNSCVTVWLAGKAGYFGEFIQNWLHDDKKVTADDVDKYKQQIKQQLSIIAIDAMIVTAITLVQVLGHIGFTAAIGILSGAALVGYIAYSAINRYYPDAGQNAKNYFNNNFFQPVKNKIEAMKLTYGNPTQINEITR